MVVVDILCDEPFQVPLVYGDDMVQQIVPTTLNPALRDAILQGLCKEVRTGVMAMDRTAIGISTLYLVSRSKIRNRGTD